MPTITYSGKEPIVRVRRGWFRLKPLSSGALDLEKEVVVLFLLRTIFNSVINVQASHHIHAFYVFSTFLLWFTNRSYVARIERCKSNNNHNIENRNVISIVIISGLNILTTENKS